MPPSAKATKEFKANAAEAPATEPGIPTTPLELHGWLEEQVRCGMLAPQALLDFRQANGLPTGSLPALAEQAPTAELTPRSKAMDARASDEAWRAVFEAYAKTGDPEELARVSGVELNLVKHLLDYGVRRLGLKPIREAAVDYAEVEHRAQALVKSSKEPQHLVHLAEARDAATERVAREAAAAQGLLISSLKTADTFLGLVNKVLARSQDSDGYMVPTQLDGKYLNKLADTALKLSSAVDKAVRLSRFAAGEPESNVAMEITALVSRMSEDDLEEYLRTKTIPRHLRIKGSQFIEADWEEVKAPPPAPPLPPAPEGGAPEGGSNGAKE